eukprot:m.229104 g.229104  ORF g.229104 m.229104 type:complete len:639 (+) comp15675_c1_seq1:293-2209(+)
MSTPPTFVGVATVACREMGCIWSKQKAPVPAEADALEADPVSPQTTPSQDRVVAQGDAPSVGEGERGSKSGNAEAEGATGTPTIQLAGEAPKAATAAGAREIGIHLEAVVELHAKLVQFNAEHPEAEQIVTTADVATKLIKPATAKLPKGAQAYFDLVDKRHRGKPSVFVSHTWLGEAIGLLKAIIAHGEGVVAAGGAPPVYYLDLASVDQHLVDQAAGTSVMPFETLEQEFVGQIKSCGEVLVVAWPFYDPLVIKRAWCIFEVVAAKTHGVPITVVTPPTEEARLVDRILEKDGNEILIKVMMTIDSSKAEATVPEDLANIRRLIERGVPGKYVEVDAIYKEVLRRWVIDLLRKLEGTFEPGSHGLMQYVSQCGTILDRVGDYDGSIATYTRALTMAVNLEGADALNVAIVQQNLGIAYQNKHEFDKSLECLHKALAIWLQTLGPDSESGANTYKNLGDTYRKKGDSDKAIECLQKALEIFLQVLGPVHPSVARTYWSLASAYHSNGQIVKAIEYHHKALEIKVQQLGPNHPSLAITYHSLGNAHRVNGEFDKAIEYLHKALGIQLQVLGPAHPEVAWIHSVLGLALQSKGELHAAVDAHRTALAIRTTALGPAHPVTLESQRCLATAERALAASQE